MICATELLMLSSCSVRVVKITLSGFPGQTCESVTNVGLTPSPVQNEIKRTGFSRIVIPGIGDGGTSVLVIPSKRDDTQSHLLHGLVFSIISVLPPFSLPCSSYFLCWPNLCHSYN